MISVEGPTMFVLFMVLSAIFLHQDNALFRESNDQGDFKTLMEILRKPRLLDRNKDQENSIDKSNQPKEALSDLDLGFQWKKCDELSDSDMKVQSLHIGPDPIKLGANISIDFSGSYTSDAPLVDPLELDLHIQKKLIVWITIPCLDGFGSCSYNNACEMVPKACPAVFQKFGIPCGCPVKPGNYELPPSIIPFPEMTHIPEWLSEGDYRIQARLRQKGKELLCVQVTLSIDD